MKIKTRIDKNILFFNFYYLGKKIYSTNAKNQIEALKDFINYIAY